MGLADVDSAIDACRKHLLSSGARGTEIEAFLTVYLLIRICGAYEKEIEGLVVARAKRSKDVEVALFVENTMKDYHGLKVSDVKGKLLAKFGSTFVALFEEFLSQEQEAAQLYQNIVLNRHSIAHGKSINITFDELILSYPKSKKVVEKIQAILA